MTASAITRLRDIVLILRSRCSFDRQYAPTFLSRLRDDLPEIIMELENAVSTSGNPVAWRCRTAIEPDWNYGEGKLTKKDFARQEPGFEEQPLYAALPAAKAPGDTSWVVTFNDEPEAPVSVVSRPKLGGAA